MLTTKKNKFRVVGRMVLVTLTNDSREFKVDKEDWDAGFKEYTWRLDENRNSGSVRVVTNYRKPDGKYRRMSLVRLLVGESKLTRTDIVTHVNDDPLDCRKKNIEVLDRKTQMAKAGVFSNRWSDEQRRGRAKQLEDIEVRRKFRQEMGLGKAGKLPSWVLEGGGDVVGGVRLVATAETAKSPFYEFLKSLVERYPLAAGSEVELELKWLKYLVPRKGLVTPGYVENRGTAYKIQVAIGHPNRGLEKALATLGHEYMHCRQWDRGEAFGSCRKRDNDIEREAEEFGVAEAAVWLRRLNMGQTSSSISAAPKEAATPRN